MHVIEGGAREPREFSTAAGWIALVPAPAFVVLHQPLGEQRDSAMLMCPPFGWEEARSYRPWRAFARGLAAAGFAAARLTFPGCGDSGGLPTDPGRLEAWTGAVAGAAAWLREQTGCARLTAIGVGLGGVVAYRALAEEAEIDDLVLWAVPATGRRLVRELKAYAAIAAAEDRSAPPRDDDEDLQLTGYVLSGETRAALGAIDLTTLPVPRAPQRRVLMLARDNLGVDQRLRGRLRELGAEVTTSVVGDYAKMMSTPQLATLDPELVPAIVEWIDGDPGDLTLPPLAGGAPGPLGEIELGSVRESVLGFDTGIGQGFAVMASPVRTDAEPVWAVLLNAGALSHVGPNRMWVETARRWAAAGLTTLRVDLGAIGEAEGPDRAHPTNTSLYDPSMVAQTVSLLDQLDDDGGPGRYILAGTCSGAYWAIHAAVADARVCGALMINLAAFKWTEQLAAERHDQTHRRAMREAARRRMRQRDLGWRHVGTALRELRGGTFSPMRVRPREAAQLATAAPLLDALRDRGTQTFVLLSEDEPLRDGPGGAVGDRRRWPQLTVEPLPSPDHLFRDREIQRHVHSSLDRAVERMLGRAHLISTPRGQPEA
jgi:alpha-beta hydrolase superfamily lysophospholipase